MYSNVSTFAALPGTLGWMNNTPFPLIGSTDISLDFVR